MSINREINKLVQFYSGIISSSSIQHPGLVRWLKVKAFVHKPDDLSSMPRTYIVEDQLQQAVL